MSIGSRIKQVRGKVPQKEFAKQLEIAQNTLGNYERSERTPNADFIITLAKHANVSFDWLLTGEEHAGVITQQKSHVQQPAHPICCPKCEVLEADLRKEREEARELTKELREINAENRTVLKENGKLKEKIGELKGELKARAAPKDITTSDSPADAASSRKHA